MTPGTHNFTKIKYFIFFPIFMTPGTRNITKIKCFNFFQISWPRVCETSQKSNASIYSYFHDHGYMKLHKKQMLNFFQFSWPRVHKTSLKSNTLIFSNFHDPGYMKHHKNQMLQFSLIFMTPGTRNFTKIKCFYFLWFSWPRVHKTSQKSNASIFSNCHDPGYTKHHKNQILQFSPIFQAWALESNQFPLLLLLAFWVQAALRQPLPL